MLRVALRHWTGILITIALLWWALFYLPTTPSYAIFQLKRAVDARNGQAAAQYVNFPSVVRHAGYEMMRNDNNALGELLGKGAVDLFSGPVAGVVRAWAVNQVDKGSRDVQMPTGAVVGAMFLIHREGNTAYTHFRDGKGREWGVHMALNDQGEWQIVQIDNIHQLIEKLAREQQKRWEKK